jgi:hypothetical protein
MNLSFPNVAPTVLFPATEGNHLVAPGLCENNRHQQARRQAVPRLRAPSLMS